MKSRKPKTIPVAPGIVMHFDGHDLFVIVDGVKVGKRDREAGAWIALDPRFKAHGKYDFSYQSDISEDTELVQHVELSPSPRRRKLPRTH